MKDIMQKIYRKKLFGTLAFSFLVLGVFVAVASFVQAKFVENPGTLVFDGLVSDIESLGGNGKKFELVLLTSGTEPVSVLVNKKTKFTGGISGADDVDPGDHLKIEAKVDNGTNTAKVVKLVESDASGYGTAGDKVFVARATVTAKTSNTFTVESAAATVTFRVNSSTKFLFTTFGKLKVGDKVMIQGRDSGSEFVAKLVVLLNRNKGGWGHGDYDHDDRWWDDHSGWHGNRGSDDHHDNDHHDDDHDHGNHR